MKIWDLRAVENYPSKSFMLSENQIAATSLAYHPTQRYMVIAGDEKGIIVVSLFFLLKL